MVMYNDRIDAAKRLAVVLDKYVSRKDVVVIGIPRGGVVLAQVLSEELKVPMDVVLVKKIGHPTNPEYAIGTVSKDAYILDKNVEGVNEVYIQNQVQKLQKLLKEREQSYYHVLKPVDLENKTILLVDDGVATGKTFISSINLLKTKLPKEIIAVFPVGAKSAIREIEKIVDKVICLDVPDTFLAVGNFYQNFNQVSDDEVLNILKTHDVF